MLEANDLAIGYSGRTIGARIDFAVASGETLCVLGPNGGGKTTLFRTLLGLLRPHGGTVCVNGRDITSISRREMARLVGYVPQVHAASFEFSVRDIVLMGRTAHLGALASPGDSDHRIAKRALDEIGIAHLADRNYTTISAGERQLALIARALAQEPKVLVMDEPTASLDFGNQLRVLDKLRTLAQRGIAIVFSSHDPDHALAVADRALLISGGRILAIGVTKDVVRADTLETLYGIPVRIVLTQGGPALCQPVPAARG